ncbi:hypothetical protein [Chryseobacterium populi]|uniref:Uncharacterized protein n=1 Tax=Chryseobacterium populi TaxID=1144316 RepID=J2SSW5_9FLAO|nr:hypothetical protein [Chryseobacterium populi]EJL68657.1 hypothetical protein PMI13_03559 [Chryseobacterium populi]
MYVNKIFPYFEIKTFEKGRKKYFYLLLFNIIIFLLGTSFIQEEGVSSKKIDFEVLRNRISIISKDRKQAFYLTKKYIDLAKKNNRTEEVITGYGFATTFAPDSEKIKYGDSLIIESVKTKDNRYIGMAYASAANASFKNYDYKKALETAIIANDYLKKILLKSSPMKGCLQLPDLKIKSEITLKPIRLQMKYMNIISGKKIRKIRLISDPHIFTL